MIKTTKKLSKIFLILTPLSSLVFLQSASYELPEYKLVVREDNVWGDLNKEEKSWTIENKNFNFDLNQNSKDWKIVVGLNSPYGGYTGQSDVVKQFSPLWFSQETNAYYAYGATFNQTQRVADGVYNINNKPYHQLLQRHNYYVQPPKTIPNDNFEIDLQNIIHGVTPQNKGEKFTYFFENFNISLRRGESYHQFVFHEGIRKLGKEFIDNKLNKNNDRGEFNLRNIKLNFTYTVNNNRITKLAVTIRADVEYKTREKKENTTSAELKKYFEELQDSFKEAFPDKYVIPTDSGATGGINAPKPTKTDRDTNVGTLKSNREYFEEKLKKWWGSKTQSNLKYKSEYKWSYWNSSGDPAHVWVEFTHPIDGNRQKFYLANPKNTSEYPTQWKPTEFFLQREFSSRLELIPSTVLKYDQRLNRLVQTIAERKKSEINQQPTNSTNQTTTPTTGQKNVYGGEFEFVGDVKVKFNGAKDGSEVLFINDKKIDVLDNQFETVLQDLRLEQKENGGTNKYKIEIRKFNQTKSEVEKSYSIDLITKSVVNILQGKWFGWDPEKNINQKKLISPFMLDDSGNEIIGQDGKKIENPDYDPNIDQNTGTKKQILWVKNNGNDLRDNIFYQDNILVMDLLLRASLLVKG